MAFDRKGFYRELGRLLKDCRVRANMTQDGVAGTLEMPRATYANIEHGRQRAPADVVWRLAIEFGVPLSRLLPEPKDRHPKQQELSASSSHDPLIASR